MEEDIQEEAVGHRAVTDMSNPRVVEDTTSPATRPPHRTDVRPPSPARLEATKRRPRNRIILRPLPRTPVTTEAMEAMEAETLTTASTSGRSKILR